MAVTLKIKRRAASGNSGSPAALKSGELAFNENTADKLLYYGYGDDGSGNATSIVAIGGAAIPNGGLANSAVTINSNAVSLGGSLTLDTDDVGEGSSNLYFTNARARSALSATTATGVTYNSSTGVVALASVPNSALANSGLTLNSNSVSLGGSLTLDTDDVGEGSSNLYYTDARTRGALSASGGISFNSSTGAFTLASIPNSALANSSITINGVATPLGGSTTTTSVDTGLGSTVTLQGTAGEVSVATSGTTFTFGLPDSVNVTNDLAVGGDLAVTGDLTVNGSLTSLSTTEVKVEDKNIVLGDTASPSDTTADGGGITLKGASDYTITWVNSTSCWTFNQGINVTSGALRIGGTAVLTASRQLKNVAITGPNNTIDNITIDGGTF